MIVEWTTVTITTTTYFWSSTLGTYVLKPVTVRAEVPKWVPVQWETQTVYETEHVYSPSAHATVTVTYAETVSVAYIPSNDAAYASTHAILLSQMHDQVVLSADNQFLPL
jgi:hypothetical protein